MPRKKLQKNRTSPSRSCKDRRLITSWRLFGSSEAMYDAGVLPAISRRCSARPGTFVYAPCRMISPSSHVRELIFALSRVSSYIHDPDAADGATRFAQLHRSSSKSVLYVDDGWNQLVSALMACAEAGGCLFGVGRRVTAIRPGPRWSVETGDGYSASAPSVVIALPPQDVLELVPYAEAIRAAAERCVPVYAACLDLGLSRLPEPRHQFALGIDEPLYLSVHSQAARLAPEGGALVHVVRYLEPDRDFDKAFLLAELEGFADLVQPGWRSLVRAVNSYGRCRLCARSLSPGLDVLQGGRASRYQGFRVSS